MKISILQCNTKNKFPFNILALAIKKIQKTDYSHMAIRFYNDHFDFYFDCNLKGTMKRNKPEFEKQYKITREIVLKGEFEYISFLDFFSLYEKAKYNVPQLIGNFLKWIKLSKTVLFGKGDKELVCSELIILMLDYYKIYRYKDSDEYDLIKTSDIALKNSEQVKYYGI